MAGVNKVIIVGNLGKDPEVRAMPSGDFVANLAVATSESWKDKQTGEQKEKTEWHRVAIFGKLAEIAGNYLKKGSKVYLEGALQTRKWTNNDGQDQYTTEIVLQGFNGVMQMLDSKPQGQQQGGGFQQQQQAPAQRQQGQSNSQGFTSGGQKYGQQQAPQQQGFANQGQQQSPQQQGGGFQQQAPQQQSPQQQQQGFVNQGQQQQAPKVNPQEPSIDYDDDIPF